MQDKYYINFFRRFARVHKLRRTALFVNVMAALHGEVLTVTHLGCAIPSEAKEKHCIKRRE